MSLNYDKRKLHNSCWQIFQQDLEQHRSFQKFLCFPPIYTSLLLSSLQIEEIFVAPEYSTQNHFTDIAVIVTDRAFKLSPTVQPVAVDWAKAHVDKVLRPSRQFGYVSFELCFILPFFI
jgi:hypothetical protein